eukprot:scaffold1715_cov334-Pavlova_lutheri.AAC.4
MLLYFTHFYQDIRKLNYWKPSFGTSDFGGYLGNNSKRKKVEVKAFGSKINAYCSILHLLLKNFKKTDLWRAMCYKASVGNFGRTICSFKL